MSLVYVKLTSSSRYASEKLSLDDPFYRMLGAHFASHPVEGFWEPGEDAWVMYTGVVRMHITYATNWRYHAAIGEHFVWSRYSSEVAPLFKEHIDLGFMEAHKLRTVLDSVSDASAWGVSFVDASFFSSGGGPLVPLSEIRNRRFNVQSGEE